VLTRWRVVAAVALLGLAACGPDVVQAGPGAPSGEQLEDVTQTTVTTTVPSGDLYEEGQCLVWDQGAGDAVFEVVPCEEEHLVEVTAGIDLSAAYPDGDALPGTDELRDLATTRCGPVAAAYLGRDLDVEEAGIILPGTEAWDAGARDAWCTVGLQREGGQRPLYVGSLRDA
jgi:hypothetical protein